MAIPREIILQEDQVCNGCHQPIMERHKAIQWKIKTPDGIKVDYYHRQCYVNRQDAAARESGLR